MKKFILIIIVLAAFGYFFNAYIERSDKRDAVVAEAKRVEHATKTDVFNMASRANSLTDWEEKLSNGESYRFEPILTLELERLWLQQKPILFVGTIKDIATHDQSSYLVVLEKNILNGIDYQYTFETDLQLSLISSKDKVDSFLKEHPQIFNDSGFNNGVAVVAQINGIRTTLTPGEDGERREVKIGDGKMVDIMYTGQVMF